MNEQENARKWRFKKKDKRERQKEKQIYIDKQEYSQRKRLRKKVEKVRERARDGLTDISLFWHDLKCKTLIVVMPSYVQCRRII